MQTVYIDTSTMTVSSVAPDMTDKKLNTSHVEDGSSAELLTTFITAMNAMVNRVRQQGGSPNIVFRLDFGASE